MWVEGGDIHDEVLDRLDGLLAPPDDLPLTPSAEELEGLAAAVAARWPEGAVPAAGGGAPTASPGDEGTEGGSGRSLPPGRPRQLRRLGSSAWRAGSVAAGLVVFSASAAAAANGGVPLPRPVRVVAYTVGLPVDSPALDDTHQHIEELKKAVKANDKPKAQATVARLQKDLRKVPADEKEEAEKKVVAVIEESAHVIEAPAPTTTTTAPAPSSTTAPPAVATTTTTVVEKEKKKGEKARATTTTTEAPAPTTTTAPEPTTTTTAPETDEPPASSTTTTTAPEPTTTSTTTTTGPPPEPTSTTTTSSSSSTTTTTAPPAEPGPKSEPPRPPGVGRPTTTAEGEPEE